MGSSASKLFEIPKFFLFGEGGTFAGSASEKDLNFKIVPHKVKDGDSYLECSIWNGSLCIDKSEPTVKKYALDREGYDKMLSDLEAEYNSRETVTTHYERIRARAQLLTDSYLSLEDYMKSSQKE
ncbi:MAG: hypothetical protein IJ251_07090 [Oscillospiraceae bacterium]|nr:hypothetical protein [Oscillospiraceae bacterium]